MHIILVKKSPRRPGSVHIGPWVTWSALALALIALPLVAVVTGYQLGVKASEAQVTRLTASLQAEVARQEAEIREARQTAEEAMNALAVRLGQMQASVTRLNALGRRLTTMSELDEGEFDFDSLPPQGGAEQPRDARPLSALDISQALDELFHEVEDRQKQFSVLETLLMNQNLLSEIVPSGRPVESGYISSRFGMRTDPINGRRAMHEGIDFAARPGTPVLAAAAGVVTFSDRNGGYGNMVEINHGNGYVTLYAHNQRNLVEVGQVVRRGEKIALLGQTGRATGPHVHFEIHRNGRPVNPLPYVQAAR